MRCVRSEFSYKSIGERILKIGPHLPKFLSNIKWLNHFLRHSVDCSMVMEVLCTLLLSLPCVCVLFVCSWPNVVRVINYDDDEDDVECYYY